MIWLRDSLTTTAVCRPIPSTLSCRTLILETYEIEIEGETGMIVNDVNHSAFSGEATQLYHENAAY